MARKEYIVGSDKQTLRDFYKSPEFAALDRMLTQKYLEIAQGALGVVGTVEQLKFNQGQADILKWINMTLEANYQERERNEQSISQNKQQAAEAVK